jgi:hypothetical protein
MVTVLNRNVTQGAPGARVRELEFRANGHGVVTRPVALAPCDARRRSFGNAALLVTTPSRRVGAVSSKRRNNQKRWAKGRKKANRSRRPTSSAARPCSPASGISMVFCRRARHTRPYRRFGSILGCGGLGNVGVSLPPVTRVPWSAPLLAGLLVRGRGRGWSRGRCRQRRGLRRPAWRPGSRG